MPATDGGLGEHIVGDKIAVGKRSIHVNRLLDEGKIMVVIFNAKLSVDRI